ncbi:tubulin binding cofactor C-domain-containing protein [Phlyctochytrium arcticum]|nr:tubulin binding cofactor C-domain-containing protein [Phlyctochytrium arcticum]
MFTRLRTWVSSLFSCFPLKKRKSKKKSADEKPAATPQTADFIPVAITAPSIIIKSKPHFDPSDLEIQNLSEDNVCRLPGSLPPGAPISIADCQKSNIFIFESTAQVTVDNCSDCCILMGPCDGSVFIRDCTDCTIISASRQFRTRNCHRLQISLYVSTQPIIETSSNLSFSCFRYYYDGLEEQLRLLHLPLLGNKWDDLYDFSTNKERDNWRIESSLGDVPPPPAEAASIHPSPSGPCIIPYTQPCISDQCIILVSFASESERFQLLRDVGTFARLLRVHERKYKADDIPVLFEAETVRTMAGQAETCMILHIDAEGTDPATVTNQLVGRDKLYICPNVLSFKESSSSLTIS